MRERTFQIQLEGLIQLLAQNLYTDPDVFLREMIQNAHDSIETRALTSTTGDLPDPRIRVVVDSAGGTIQIQDNGAGMTDEQIDAHLSTIGRSGTAELRSRLALDDRSRVVDLIGQFGIGLLSAFIVADRVTVLTRADGHEGLRWESDGSRNYTVEPAPRSAVGTTVVLHLRLAYRRRYLDRRHLKTIIRTYADFIGMPVYLDDDPEATNAVVAPWHREHASAEERLDLAREFWTRRFHDESPLHLFCVDESVSWSGRGPGGGPGHARVRGVLAVTSRHVADVTARGTVDLYVRKMFIGSANRDLLPPWAAFLQGAVECDELLPNAARDNVVHNHTLTAVRDVLGRIVLAELIGLARHDPDRFGEVVAWHPDAMLALANQDANEEFFRSVAHLMPLNSDQGPMTVAEYLASAADRVIYYITEPGSATQYSWLAKARGIRLFSCNDPQTIRFLQRYAAIAEQPIRLERLDVDESTAIFEPLGEADAKHFAGLQVAYARAVPDSGSVARVSRFQPPELPAVLIEGAEGRARWEMERAAGNQAVPDAVRALMQNYLAAQPDPLVLHLNANNPTIKKLADRADPHDEVSRQALVALHNNALMLLARNLPVERVELMFEQYNQVIELLLSMAEVRDEGAAAPAAASAELDPYVSCFVAMPFDEGDVRAQQIYRAIEQVLEGHPFYWSVIRADDQVENPALWPNLKAQLLRAHCFVAILTERMNPNVMIEIGRMEAIERPLVLIRDVAAPELPADLKERVYIEVRGGPAELPDELRDHFGRHSGLKALTGRDRYLSATVLTRYGLNDAVSRAISREYQTWSAFLAADPAAVAHRCSTSVGMVNAVKDDLRALRFVEG